MVKEERENKDLQDGDLNRETPASGRGMPYSRRFFRTCKECGVPNAISSNHVWEEHGTILNRDNTQRLIIVETKILDGILRRAAEIVGENVDKTFLYAKAFDASHYARSLIPVWRKASLGYPLFKRPYYEILCDQARVLGMADASIVHYQRGKEVVISCTQCYNKIFFAGDILGAVFEGEGKEATIEIKEEAGQTYFMVEIIESATFDAIRKYSFSWEVPLPGHVNYKRCKRCGTPFAVSFLAWNFPKGLMIDTHNGEPVTLIDVAGMNSAYEEIREEQGRRIDDFLAQEVKSMVDRIIPGLEWKHRRPEERIRDLFFLAYRGMGNPIFTEPIEDGIRARVENPFNYPLVAGIATSFLARGKPVAFEWERSMPGRLEVQLHFP